MTESIDTLVARARTYKELQAKYPDTPLSAVALTTEMADKLEGIRASLAHHFNWQHDPCQDRGVNWPCDVADALEVASR